MKSKKPQTQRQIEQRKAALVPFVKGDPRINRNGVPKDAIAARQFIKEIGAELVRVAKEAAAEGEVESEEVTRYANMIRKMYRSSQPRDRELILKATTPGLLKDEMDVTTAGKEIGAAIVFYLPNNGRDNNGNSNTSRN